jgi:hypothetical protein
MTKESDLYHLDLFQFDLLSIVHEKMIRHRVQLDDNINCRDQ